MHPPCPGTIWAVPSGVPRNLTCCPNGDCNSHYNHSWSGSHNLPPNNFPLTPIIQTSFWASCEDQPLSEDWLYMTKMPEFLQFSTAKIRHHEIRHISLSTWGVWFTLGLVEMPTEERRLVAEDGSKSKNTWLQKIARGWRCLVSSCAGPRHRL